LTNNEVATWKRQIFKEDLNRLIIILFNPNDVLDREDIISMLYARHGLIFDKQDIIESLKYLSRTGKIKTMDDGIYCLSSRQENVRMKIRNARET